MRKKKEKKVDTQIRPQILVYKDEYGIYIKDDGNNCWWSFHFDANDLETMKLCETSIGWEREEKTKNPDNLTPIPNELVTAFLNNHSKQYNRLTIYNIIQQMYGMSEDDIDKLYHRDVQAAELAKKAVKEYSKDNKRRRNTDDWFFKYHMRDWYQEARNYRKNGWDDQRIINYLVRREIPLTINHAYDYTMIDIFGEMHPTKYSLLYEFYYNGNEAIMDEAVEKYPDENDIDKAYYYYVEHAYGKHY